MDLNDRWTKHLRATSRVATDFDDGKNFDQGPPPQGSLWTGDQSPAPSCASSSKMGGSLLLPESATRPISHEQLISEVKAIYAGLVMVVSKCIEVDNKQSSQTTTQKLNNDQWQTLITLHKTLLHEHHDFFLASQHPAASPALKHLPSKYAMPTRIWLYGTHTFPEPLRHRSLAPPESTRTIPYETVPAFKDTWIKRFEDSGWYCMTIKDKNMKNRDIWTGVSRDRHIMTTNHPPIILDRLYHFPTLSAWHNAAKWPFYNTRSLFWAPLGGYSQLSVTADKEVFIRCHGAISSSTHVDGFRSAFVEFKSSLEDQTAFVCGPRGDATSNGTPRLPASRRGAQDYSSHLLDYSAHHDLSGRHGLNSFGDPTPSSECHNQSLLLAVFNLSEHLRALHRQHREYPLSNQSDLPPGGAGNDPPLILNSHSGQCRDNRKLPSDGGADHNFSMGHLAEGPDGTYQTDLYHHHNHMLHTLSDPAIGRKLLSAVSGFGMSILRSSDWLVAHFRPCHTSHWDACAT